MHSKTKRNPIANSCFEDGFTNWRWDGDATYGELVHDTDNPIAGTGSARISVYENPVRIPGI